MSDNNGYVRSSMFKWIVGIVITILLFMGGNVIANDQASRQRDEDLQKCLHSYIIPMKESIARIETKLNELP